MNASGLGRRGGTIARHTSKLPTVPTRPRDTWWIGSFLSDLVALDPKTGLSLSRPTVTIAVDVCTGIYCGFSITFNRAPFSGISSCLVHSVMDKSTWIGSLNLGLSWPVCGLPDSVSIDSGMTSPGTKFKRACDEFGMKIECRSNSRLDSYLEAFVALSRELHQFSRLPTTRVESRADHDDKAYLTVEEICRLLSMMVVRYNATCRPWAGISPEADWKRRAADRTARMPVDFAAFIQAFLPRTMRPHERQTFTFLGINAGNDA